MNDKITFPRLATLLADRSGRSKRFSEDFLREFFALISETLEAGESVKIKGLGIFRLTHVEPRKSIDVTTGMPMEINGHTKVVFIPAKELAEAVNAPFEAFTAIEISDDTDLSQVFSQEEIDLQQSDGDMDEPYDSDKHEEPASKDIIGSPEESGLSAKTEETDYIERIDDYHAPEYTEENSIPDEADMGAATAAEGNEALEASENSESFAEKDKPSDSVNSQVFAGEQNMEVADIEHSEEDTEEENDSDGEPEEAYHSEEGTEEMDNSEDESEYDEELLDPQKFRKKSWKRILLISLGAAMFALIATFTIWYFFATNDFNRTFHRTADYSGQKPEAGFMVGGRTPALDTAIAETETSPAADTTTDATQMAEESEVPTAPSDALVYDTVSTTRYLTTIAKAHYGNYNLWPFIYEENKSILGHPDRIRPGTPVVVPKLSKYGVDPSKKEDVEKAKKMGVEIYARFGKKI